MRILIIEDDRLTARVLQRCLQKAGYEGVTALSCAEDAFYAVYEQQYDLLLIDWILPGVSGLEFVRHLRAHVLYEDVPIIMVTTKSDAQDVEQAVEAGVSDYVRKPDRGWGPTTCKNLIQRVEEFHSEIEASDTPSAGGTS